MYALHILGRRSGWKDLTLNLFVLFLKLLFLGGCLSLFAEYVALTEENGVVGAATATKMFAIFAY